MRYVLNIKINKGVYIGVIGKANSAIELKDIAIKLSNRLWGDKELHIKPSSKVVNSDEWEQERILNVESGNKMYQVAFLLDDIVQSVLIKASSYKSAYNNIKIKYGIEDNIFMMIYELNQGKTKLSALNESNSILNNTNKLNDLLTTVIEKIKYTAELDNYKHKISIIFHIIKDTYTSKYAGLSYNDMVYVVAHLVYFNDSIKYIPDMLSKDAIISENDAIILLVKKMDNSIDKYLDWREVNGR